MTRGVENYRREREEALREIAWWWRPFARFIDWRMIRREGGWM